MDSKFLPSDKSPTYGVGGVVASEAGPKGELGKFLPRGDKYMTDGVTSEVGSKGAMGKMLPEGKRTMVKGV